MPKKQARIYTRYYRKYGNHIGILFLPDKDGLTVPCVSALISRVLGLSSMGRLSSHSARSVTFSVTSMLSETISPFRLQPRKVAPLRHRPFSPMRLFSALFLLLGDFGNTPATDRLVIQSAAMKRSSITSAPLPHKRRHKCADCSEKSWFLKIHIHTTPSFSA